MNFAPFSSAECDVLPAVAHGKTMRLIVVCWRLFTALWAVVALFFAVIALVGPPLLFVLALFRGKNPFQAAVLLPLAGSVLSFVALMFGVAAIRAYGLFVQPTRLVSVRFLAFTDLISGLLFSVFGAAAEYLMWRGPEEKMIYSAYLLFGIVVFPVCHAFRRKG